MEIDTVIIGGGQAGLTMSHALSLRGRPHVVLERARVAERWRSERWDSLRFQFPNWAMRLPSFGYTGDAPDVYAHRDDVVRFIEDYAASIEAPVRTGVEVRSLRPGFVLDTSDGPIAARNVVIATGPYQQPVIPDAATGLGAVVQLTASSYRNPAQLPPGAVLVAGSGASGCQIAEELLQSGRRVFLSVGAHRRVPRRYRGRDMIWWIDALGMDDRVADEQESRKAPLVISGANGGCTVDLRRYAAEGMRLLGRVQGARGGVLSLATDLADMLAAGDAAYAGFVNAADAYAGTSMPAEPPAPVFPEPPPPPATLDIAAAGIRSVIWATGYRTDFSWVGLDVFAPNGAPMHKRGVTGVPGAYFLGLRLLHKVKSSFLSGVGEDAAWIAEHIDSHRARYTVDETLMSEANMTDTGLTSQESRDLRRVAGLMVPASTEYNVPGADDAKIMADIEKSIGRDMVEMHNAFSVLAGIADMDDATAMAKAEAFRSAGGPAVAAVERCVLQCYYRDDRVVISLGLEARAPFPLGHTLEQGDWSLLDPVRARPKMWRDA